MLGAKVHTAILRCLVRVLPALPARPVTQLRGVAAAAAEFVALHACDGAGAVAVDALLVCLQALTRGCPAAAQEVLTVYGDDEGFARVNAVMHAELTIMAEVCAARCSPSNWYLRIVWIC
jgi:hypothetical protein